MLTFHLYQDSLAVYYNGRRIPTVALYTTPTLHYIQHVALYVAKRLTELGISAFRHPDAHAARVIEIACGGACRWSQDGEEIESLLEEAYYNHLADRIIAITTTADSLIIPCIDRPLAKALVKRAREYAPDLTLIASEYGGECPEADYVHNPQPLEAPIPLGPASRAVLHTAVWSIDEGIAEAPVAPLLDARCNI
ncbi:MULTISPECIES: hypothetical protein [Pyrobaculum]|uniref:Uncharacterized protein n=2 Tax=Pyrobaculum arsenaticum TaxID=121277 RepID=A4WMN1_PYRAR|nr:hypothetical protein [Pyrobaculum arsenaticum]ABP51648.1 conserved hypothetical protein [Pyrobaculum arsenaticum DSM 13514]MCY0890689.1 hypothetical protein [Pyrobaculum arsenaticum]NYR15968.1 hypothetical protein [Pyrobaculum arsenaticum]